MLTRQQWNLSTRVNRFFTPRHSFALVQSFQRIVSSFSEFQRHTDEKTDRHIGIIIRTPTRVTLELKSHMYKKQGYRIRDKKYIPVTQRHRRIYTTKKEGILICKSIIFHEVTFFSNDEILQYLSGLPPTDLIQLIW